jgi:hypothetical protein
MDRVQGNEDEITKFESETSQIQDIIPLDQILIFFIKNNEFFNSNI